jgi:hypothetical protein
MCKLRIEFELGARDVLGRHLPAEALLEIPFIALGPLVLMHHGVEPALGAEQSVSAVDLGLNARRAAVGRGRQGKNVGALA